MNIILQIPEMTVGFSFDFCALLSHLSRFYSSYEVSLDESERGEWKIVGLKLNIQKTKITVSGPITSWQIDGGTLETVTDFMFLGSKITADGDCSHQIKRCFLLERKAMTNLDSILKSRDIITLPKRSI